MASSKLLRLALALGLGLVLLVVSCAPAAEPTAAPTTPPPTPTSPPPTTAPTLAPGVTPTATATAAAQLIATPRPPTPTPAPLAEQPRRGGTLMMGTGGTVPDFSSWETCCGGPGAKFVTDSVLQYKPANDAAVSDEVVEGRMAYDWRVSQDGLSWTLKLEPDMKAALPAAVGGGFEVVDCEDVAWSIMTIKSGEGLRRTFRGRTFAPVTKVECPDPLTAVIYTKTPYGALPGMLAVSINVMNPKGYWETRLKELPRWVVGSGPWMLQSHIAQERTVYVPNPYYHRKAPDGKAYPYLTRIDQIANATIEACGSALRVGRVHMCGSGGVTHNTGADLLFREAKHLQFYGPFRTEDNPAWGSKGLLGDNAMFLQAHHEKAPWNNVKMREALSLALDRKTLCDISVEKWCVPGNFVFWIGTPWNLPKDQVWSYPGYNINTVDQNLARARQTLTDLGYKLYPDSKALTIDLPAWFNTGLYIQAPAVEMLRRAGFNPNFYVPESNRVLAQVVAGEFDAVAWDQLVSHPDPNQVCYEHYYTGSDRNYGRYSNPKADDLCEKMGQELDRTKRAALANQFAKLIMDDHARATFLWRGSGYAVSPDVRNFEFSAQRGGGAADRIEKWWLVK